MLESKFEEAGNELSVPRRLYCGDDSLWAQILLAKFYYCCASSLVRMAIFEAESCDEVIPGDVRAEVVWFSTLLWDPVMLAEIDQMINSTELGEYIIVSGTRRLVDLLECYWCPKELKGRRRDPHLSRVISLSSRENNAWRVLRSLKLRKYT